MIIIISLQYAFLSDILTIEKNENEFDDLDGAIEFLTNNIGRDNILRLIFKKSKKEYVLNLKYFSMFKIMRKDITDESEGNS